MGDARPASAMDDEGASAQQQPTKRIRVDMDAVMSGPAAAAVAPVAGAPSLGTIIDSLYIPIDKRYREDIPIDMSVLRRRFDALGIDKARLYDELLVFLASLTMPLVEHHSRFKDHKLESFYDLRELHRLPKQAVKDKMMRDMGLTALQTRCIMGGLERLFPGGPVAEF